MSRPDLWEKAKKKVGEPAGLWGIYEVWQEYWRLLKEDDAGSGC